MFYIKKYLLIVEKSALPAFLGVALAKAKCGMC